MNILMKYDEGGLGDTLAILPFAKDFHDQYPDDKLFITYPGKTSFQKQRNLLFLNNPDISLYNGEKIDKEFFYDVPSFPTDMENENIISKLYKIFFRILQIKVEQNTFYIPWYFTDKELSLSTSFIKINKPICIINSGYNLLVSSKNYGYENFEYIINELKDKVLFIQVGETVLNKFIHKLHKNVIDLRNKLNLRSLAFLLNLCDFVLCHTSSLNIFAGITPTKQRTVFTFCGNREYADSHQKMFNHPLLNTFILDSKNDYTSCYNKKYCLIQKISECKHICKVGDEYVCQCLNDIDKNFVINKIKELIK